LVDFALFLVGVLVFGLRFREMSFFTPVVAFVVFPAGFASDSRQ
jgi:hypothetical protein